MQAGYMDKAQKYTEEALTQIEKLKSMFTYKDLSRVVFLIVCFSNSFGKSAFVAHFSSYFLGAHRYVSYS